MNRRITNAAFTLMLSSLVIVSACVVVTENALVRTWSKHERIERLSAPLEAASLLVVKTHNGSILVAGEDAAEYDIIATIRARAGSEEEARELADHTEIKLEPSGDRLFVRINKPVLRRNRSVSVSFKITVPRRARLDLTSHNGAIQVLDVSGDIRIDTHNAPVTVKETSGNVNVTSHNGPVRISTVSGLAQLHTHNGSITAEEITGNIKATTHNGRASVAYSSAAPSSRDISVETHNGAITLRTPANFSASADLSTHNGSIRSELPTAVVGRMDKKFHGIIGKGEGKLHLKTHNGSIRIK